MFQWSEKFETGHPLIDSQHQLLVGYVNRLEELTRLTNPSRQEAEFILSLVDFIEAYTSVHFKHEEGCMIRHRCPAYADNKTAHEDFLRFFRDFKRRLSTEGCRHEVLQDLYTACCNWIEQHILHIDLRLKPCLKTAESDLPD